MESARNRTILNENALSPTWSYKSVGRIKKKNIFKYICMYTCNVQIKNIYTHVYMQCTNKKNAKEETGVRVSYLTVRYIMNRLKLACSTQ